MRAGWNISAANRRGLRARGIVPRIARKGIESRERLGRFRWVVERELAWLHRLRRLLIRYERRPDIQEAFLTLASILILWQAVRRLEGKGPIRAGQQAGRANLLCNETRP